MLRQIHYPVVLLFVSQVLLHYEAGVRRVWGCLPHSNQLLLVSERLCLVGYGLPMENIALNVGWWHFVISVFRLLPPFVGSYYEF